MARRLPSRRTAIPSRTSETGTNPWVVLLLARIVEASGGMLVLLSVAHNSYLTMASRAVRTGATMSGMGEAFSRSTVSAVPAAMRSLMSRLHASSCNLLSERRGT